MVGEWVVKEIGGGGGGGGSGGGISYGIRRTFHTLNISPRHTSDLRR